MSQASPHAAAAAIPRPRHTSHAQRPVTVALVGAGRRASLYARFALARPDRAKVVAVAEPDGSRRGNLADLFGVPASMRFASFADLAARPGVAEAVINASPVAVHFESSMALLSAGYHLLLEKPVALEMRHVRALAAEVARRRECRTPPCQVVMVRHVLRYEPLYREVKDRIVSGRIGRVTSLRTAQHVAYHRLASLFIRRPRDEAPPAAPLLLDEGCHDLDLLAWLLADHAASPRVAQVASFAASSRNLAARSASLSDVNHARIAASSSRQRVRSAATSSKSSARSSTSSPHSSLGRSSSARRQLHSTSSSWTSVARRSRSVEAAAVVKSTEGSSAASRTRSRIQ